MVRIWAAILLVSILIHSFSSQVIFTEFLLKRDYIAKVLCEKKAEKGNQCQGKCQLKKQLQKDNDRQEKNHQQLKTSIEVLFSKDQESLVFKYFPLNTETPYNNLSSEIVKGFLSGIFHPPAC